MTGVNLNMNLPTWVYLAAGGVVAGIALYAVTRGAGGVAEDVTSGIGSGIGGALKGTGTAAGAVIEGAIVGLGNVVGIDETNKTQCQKDLAAGNTWAASFSCPAKDFIGSFFK